MHSELDTRRTLAEQLRGPVLDAALRLIAGAFRRDGEQLDARRRPRFSIPTRPQDDDDCVVIDALKAAAEALEASTQSTGGSEAKPVSLSAELIGRLRKRAECESTKIGAARDTIFADVLAAIDATRSRS